MKEKHDKNVISSIGYYIVWTTKFRHSVLKGPVELELRNIIAQTCIAYNWSLYTSKIDPDHIVMFLQANPEDNVSDIVKTIKSISAVRLFDKFPNLKQQKFWGTGLWSNDYFVSTEKISENRIFSYVQSQKIKS